MSTGSTKPEWDTPPHGDFASYVERLSTPKPAVPVSPHAARIEERGATSSGPSSPAFDTSAASLDLIRRLTPLRGGLHIARVLLLVLIVIHAVALVLWGWGSLVALLMMAGLWWGLGRVRDLLGMPLPAPDALTGSVAQSNQTRLRQTGLQRQSGKKKQ